MDKCILLGYDLGTCDGWDGDVEQLMFNSYKPNPTIIGWPVEADTICIDLLSGRVQAFGQSGDPLAEWDWSDYVAMI